MEKVFISWSGGKDCSLAYYRAQRDGLDVHCLASMITEGTERLWPHHLTPEVLSLQAEAMDVPLILRRATAETYAEKYRQMLKDFRAEGLSGGVFGDVSIGNGLAEEHRRWVDDVCLPEGITPHRPLWGQGREELITDLIESGFEAIIIMADDKLGKDFLGRKLNWDLLQELKLRYELSPTGEVGYYHTFVIDGPNFKKRLQILEADKVFANGFWFLDITRCALSLKVREAVLV
jgi:uncharacterized protein (TIGR00290 family)